MSRPESDRVRGATSLLVAKRAEPWVSPSISPKWVISGLVRKRKTRAASTSSVMRSSAMKGTEPGPKLCCSRKNRPPKPMTNRATMRMNRAFSSPCHMRKGREMRATKAHRGSRPAARSMFLKAAHASVAWLMNRPPRRCAFLLRLPALRRANRQTGLCRLAVSGSRAARA